MYLEDGVFAVCGGGEEVSHQRPRHMTRAGRRVGLKRKREVCVCVNSIRKTIATHVLPFSCNAAASTSVRAGGTPCSRNKATTGTDPRLVATNANAARAALSVRVNCFGNKRSKNFRCANSCCWFSASACACTRRVSSFSTSAVLFFSS